MSVNKIFDPAYGSTQSINAVSTSASITLSAPGQTLQVVNSDTVTMAFVRISDGAITASMADVPILPLERVYLTKSDKASTVAACTATGSAKLYFTPGEGGY